MLSKCKRLSTDIYKGLVWKYIITSKDHLLLKMKTYFIKLTENTN